MRCPASITSFCAFPPPLWGVTGSLWLTLEAVVLHLVGRFLQCLKSAGKDPNFAVHAALRVQNLFRRLNLRVVKVLLLVLLVALLVPYLVAPFYRTGHPVSTLMAWRSLRGAPVQRQWIGLAKMSHYVPFSVVAAEDAHFCKHHGIDWGALREAINDAQEGSMRGASTITQQVAKNLFLWQGRDPIRKVLEFPLALWIDLVLPKQRILEIYLNIAELGPRGQFGVEAASAYAFGKSAASLSPREAALLAAILPSPARRSARNPGPGVQRLARTYMVRAAAPGSTSCWGEIRPSEAFLRAFPGARP